MSFRVGSYKLPLCPSPSQIEPYILCLFCPGQRRGPRAVPALFLRRCGCLPGPVHRQRRAPHLAGGEEGAQAGREVLLHRARGGRTGRTGGTRWPGGGSPDADGATEAAGRAHKLRAVAVFRGRVQAKQGDGEAHTECGVPKGVQSSFIPQIRRRNFRFS